MLTYAPLEKDFPPSPFSRPQIGHVWLIHTPNGNIESKTVKQEQYSVVHGRQKKTQAMPVVGLHMGKKRSATRRL